MYSAVLITLIVEAIHRSPLSIHNIKKVKAEWRSWYMSLESADSHNSDVLREKIESWENS